MFEKAIEIFLYPSILRAILIFILSYILNATAVTNIINVVDFGAIANDALDDTYAINAALAACDKSGATLNFETGTYLIQGTQPNTPIFTIDGYHNLTIEGNNAFLSCKNWDAVFYAQNSSQITIRDITLDWDRDLPFSYGMISSIGVGYIDVTLTAPQVARAGLKTEAILEYDPAHLKPSDYGFDIYQNGLDSTKIISSNIMRCYTNANLNTGADVVIRHQVYMNNTFAFIKVNGIALSNIVVYSAAGMAVFGYSNTNVSLDNFQVKRYGTRWMSTNADGIHFSSTRGTININNCILQGMGDDGMNIHGMFYRIQNVSANVLCLRDAVTNSTPFWWDLPLNGDTLVIIDPATMIIKGEAKVVSSSSDAANNCLSVTFNSIGTGIVAGDQLYNKNTVAVLNVTNTIVEKNRARGMLIQTSNVHVSGTAFNQCSGPGIMLTSTTAGTFIESSVPSHVTISGCNFNNCNYGAISMNAPLVFYTNTTSSQYASAVIDDIHINNNLFTTISNQPAIFIRSAKNVYTDSNQFSNNSVVQIDYINDNNEYCNIFIDRNSITGATAYKNTVSLPSKIEAENFDNGGEGVGYHDVTLFNEGNSNYREGERVDIFDMGGGVIGINYTVCSEWLGYTVNVPQNGYYNVIVRGSTAVDGATFHLERDFNFLTSEIQFPNTGGWSSFQDDTVRGVYLSQGTYQIKFVWDNLGINLDYLQFDKGTATAIKNNPSQNLVIYPNPFTNSLYISIPDEKVIYVQMFDISSCLVMTTNSDCIYNLSLLPTGIYYLKIQTDRAEYIKHIVKI